MPCHGYPFALCTCFGRKEFEENFMVLISPSINIQIRPMRLDDIEQVKAIDYLSFSLPWPENAYRYEVVENPASLSWVAETDITGGEKKICGMVVIWLIPVSYTHLRAHET